MTIEMSDRPWMTAIEMQFAAARLARDTLKAQDVRVSRDKDFVVMLKSAVEGLPVAVTHTWSRDVLAAVTLASKTIPRETRLASIATLNDPVEWWWFEESALPFVSNPWLLDDESIEDEARIHGVMLATALFKGRLGLGVMTFGRLKSGPPFPSTLFVWDEGETVAAVAERWADCYRELPNEHDDQTACHARHLPSILLAAFAWRKQRILVSSSGHVERHRRKQLARENNAPLPSDVKVIQLRRIESSDRPVPGNAEAVEWSCRWIVNGHWRNQVYKNDERKLIYIMPHVKGPDDKPLRVPSHTVYTVNR